MFTKFGSAARLFGVDVKRTKRVIGNLDRYRKNRSEFRYQLDNSADEPFVWGKMYPSIGDDTDASGRANGHYFHGDLWTARRVFENAPRRHIDVGSRVDGLVAHIASFREIDVLDIRPNDAQIENINFLVRDLMEEDPAFDAITDSLSSLHVLEHFGLGRYGDPINVSGYRAGWANIVRMIEPGGRFYFSTPMGERQRIEFDAHRIFSLPFLLDELIDPGFDVARFAWVGDDRQLRDHADPREGDARRSFGCRWGCAIFELVKR